MSPVALHVAALALHMSAAASSTEIKNNNNVPLLVRAARGEPVDKTPVWMMRQAGRHMQVYRDLVKKYPTFRQRSETPDVSFEITLQPYRAYKTDGVVLFSDILTPLPAMGVDFDISEGGGITIDPIRTRDAFERMKSAPPFAPEKDIPFVGSVLTRLREELADTDAAVLGFVGLPFTLASYVVEGATGTKTGFAEFRALRANDPTLAEDILSLLADKIAQYAIYQIDSGAHVVQVFDSWAGHLEPDEFDTWAAPYQRRVVSAIKAARPDVPVIIYMAPDKYSKNGALIERLAATGVDVVSLDHTVDIGEARARLDAAGYDKVGIQGNLDPEVLRDASPDEIIAATNAIISKVGNRGHVMNLGHGIEPTTPEENALLFVNTVHAYKHEAVAA